eukprot:5304616-Amphidinium_carterae.1
MSRLVLDLAHSSLVQWTTNAASDRIRTGTHAAEFITGTDLTTLQVSKNRKHRNRKSSESPALPQSTPR